MVECWPSQNPGRRARGSEERKREPVGQSDDAGVIALRLGDLFGRVCATTYARPTARVNVAVLTIILRSFTSRLRFQMCAASGLRDSSGGLRLQQFVTLSGCPRGQVAIQWQPHALLDPSSLRLSISPSTPSVRERPSRSHITCASASSSELIIMVTVLNRGTRGRFTI